MIKTGIIRARDSEVRMNIRSRSAKLRVAERTEAASWGQSEAEIKL